MAKHIEVIIHADGRITAETVNMAGEECLIAPEILKTLVNAEVVDSHYLESFYKEGAHEQSNQRLLRQEEV